METSTDTVWFCKKGDTAFPSFRVIWNLMANTLPRKALVWTTVLALLCGESLAPMGSMLFTSLFIKVNYSIPCFGIKFWIATKL